MKLLQKAKETMESVTATAEEASDAMALQTAVLMLVGIGVIVATAVGVSALIARTDPIRKGLL